MNELVPVFLRRNRATAARVEEILRLPDSNWTDVQIEFGTDSIAHARVGLIISGEQLRALAVLAAEPPDSATPDT